MGPSTKVSSRVTNRTEKETVTFFATLNDRERRGSTESGKLYGLKSELAEDRGEKIELPNDPRKTLKFVDWSQTHTDVSFTLFAGRKLTEKDIAVDFMDSEVKVGLTDGRKWSCRFAHQVNRCQSRVQTRKCKVILTVKKHLSNVTWTHLEEQIPNGEPSLLSEMVTPASAIHAGEHCGDSKERESAEAKVRTMLKDHSLQETKSLSASSLPETKLVVKKRQASHSETNEALVRRAAELIKEAELNFSSIKDWERQPEVSKACSTSPCSMTLHQKNTDMLVQKLKSQENVLSDEGAEFLIQKIVAAENVICVDGFQQRVPMEGYVETVNVDEVLRTCSVLTGVESVAHSPAGITSLQNIEVESVFNNGSCDFDCIDASEQNAAVEQVSKESFHECVTTKLLHKYLAPVARPVPTAGILMSDIADISNLETNTRFVADIVTGVLADTNNLDNCSVQNSTVDYDAFSGTGSFGIKSSLHLDSAKEESMELSTVTDKQEVESMEMEESVTELPFIKHDHYGISPCTQALSIQVKNMKNVNVKFEAFSVRIVFQTSDEKFLSSYEGSTLDTKFGWTLPLANEIIANQSTVQKPSMHKVEICLKKKTARNWTSLTPLASAPKTFVTTANSDWIPAAPPAPSLLPSASGMNSVLSSKGGIMFDELTDPDTLPPSARRPLNSTTQPVKPTCKVSPVTSATCQISRKPTVGETGLVGLVNLGNTCFMNSVIQILANTPELRSYFLDNSFYKDLNEGNPLGMRGRLAKSFAVLMRNLWNEDRECYAPERLKSLVAEKHSSFAGYSQHDAEEFMEFLLDGLHEDLNRIRKKPYIEEQDLPRRSDEVEANEAWKRHRARNDSRISDIFQGQYRSKLTCPLCNKVSITFDPFSVIQVPIPKKKSIFDVIYMPLILTRKPIQIRIHLDVTGTVMDLKLEIAKKKKVPTATLR